MTRLGVAFSGGADPAEIVQCVRLTPISSSPGSTR